MRIHTTTKGLTSYTTYTVIYCEWHKFYFTDEIRYFNGSHNINFRQTYFQRHISAFFILWNQMLDYLFHWTNYAKACVKLSHTLYFTLKKSTSFDQHLYIRFLNKTNNCSTSWSTVEIYQMIYRRINITHSWHLLFFCAYTWFLIRSDTSTARLLVWTRGFNVIVSWRHNQIFLKRKRSFQWETPDL
jgi:hypothetical protein